MYYWVLLEVDLFETHVSIIPYHLLNSAVNVDCKMHQYIFTHRLFWEVGLLFALFACHLFHHSTFALMSEYRMHLGLQFKGHRCSSVLSARLLCVQIYPTDFCVIEGTMQFYNKCLSLFTHLFSEGGLHRTLLETLYTTLCSRFTCYLIQFIPLTTFTFGRKCLVIKGLPHELPENRQRVLFCSHFQHNDHHHH